MRYAHAAARRRWGEDRTRHDARGGRPARAPRRHGPVCAHPGGCRLAAPHVRAAAGARKAQRPRRSRPVWARARGLPSDAGEGHAVRRRGRGQRRPRGALSRDGGQRARSARSQRLRREQAERGVGGALRRRAGGAHREVFWARAGAGRAARHARHAAAARGGGADPSPRFRRGRHRHVVRAASSLRAACGGHRDARQLRCRGVRRRALGDARVFARHVSQAAREILRGRGRVAAGAVCCRGRSSRRRCGRRHEHARAAVHRSRAAPCIRRFWKCSAHRPGGCARCGRGRGGLVARRRKRKSRGRPRGVHARSVVAADAI
mmetsp:Transcript_12424/g.52237  ORF Transcript_12424/g.52237 Transcript_12424/m.52237 type:complete len:320 (+) Transcript_12424:240-1199(+)